ncbi:MAG: alcohol dehydrogenase catalytic domain-containing protein, partial [Deltaproteobacteria bacterium]
MRAAVFHEPGQPLSIEEVPDPAPGPGDLVLRVRGCGICGSDLHIADLPGALPAGSVMGHEFSGEVAEVGAAVRGRFRAGERVCALPFIACGTCEHCLSGDGIRCPEIHATGLGPIPGAYAEYVRVSAVETLRLPESVGFREGATVEPLAVGLHAVNEARLEPGEDVLVVGAGPIGLATTLWARFRGARHVIVSERVPSRLALAAAFGATDAIDASQQEVPRAFETAAGKGPDVIFECVGLPGLIQQCIAMATPRSRIVVAGVCMQPDTLIPGMAVVKGLSLRFVLGYRRQDFALTLDMLAAERIRSAPMITDTVALDGFVAAFEALKRPTQQ